MYDEMTNSDFIVLMMKESHPDDNPSAEHASLMDEAVRRIRKLDALVIAWESAAEVAGGVETPEDLRSFIAACVST